MVSIYTGAVEQGKTKILEQLIVYNCKSTEISLKELSNYI